MINIIYMSGVRVTYVSYTLDLGLVVVFKCDGSFVVLNDLLLSLVMCLEQSMYKNHCFFLLVVFRLFLVNASNVFAIKQMFESSPLKPIESPACSELEYTIF